MGFSVTAAITDLGDGSNGKVRRSNRRGATRCPNKVMHHWIDVLCLCNVRNYRRYI